MIVEVEIREDNGALRLRGQLTNVRLQTVSALPTLASGTNIGRLVYYNQTAHIWNGTAWDALINETMLENATIDGGTA